MPEAQSKRKYSILLSYRDGDRDFAAELVKLLNAVGFDVLQETGELKLTGAGQENLEAKISKCDGVVVLFGQERLGPWFEPDIETTYEHLIKFSKPLIPVLLPNGPTHDQLPRLLRRFMVLDFSAGISTSNFSALYWGLSKESLSEDASDRILRLALRTTSPFQSFRTTNDKPLVFVSYSHKDSKWKDQLLSQLKALENNGNIKVWDDKVIKKGDDWDPEIIHAIEQASVAICLVSAFYMASPYCVHKELSLLLKRRSRDGMVILPILIRPYPEGAVPWLSGIHMYTYNGKPLNLASPAKVDEVFKEVADRVNDLVTLKPRSHVDLSRIPLEPEKWYGRQDELNALDAIWHGSGEHSQHNIVTLCGAAGVGKTALMSYWLLQMQSKEYGKAQKVFGWSFFNRGPATSDAELLQYALQQDGFTLEGESEKKAVSAEDFIRTALEFFGDPSPDSGSPWDRGKRLAELMRGSSIEGGSERETKQDDRQDRQPRRCLLLLDRLDVLLVPAGLNRGYVVDPALETLLESLARADNVLVVITTRVDLVITGGLQKHAYPIDLENISSKDAHQMLAEAGIGGKKDQDKICNLFSIRGRSGCHVLCLSLLIGLVKRLETPSLIDIHDYLKGLSPDDTLASEKVVRILSVFEKHLYPNEVSILRMLALFKRPAQIQELEALCKDDSENLTGDVKALKHEDWQELIQGLIEINLIYPGTVNGRYAIDVHPLVRDYFVEQLGQDEFARAWRSGHWALYKHFVGQCDPTKPETFPKTFAEMQPLFDAVMHGCAAGEYNEVWLNVFWGMIRRRFKHFSGNELGCWSDDLAALSHFFEGRWDSPSVKLHDEYRARAFNEVGFDLRALARLEDAIEPTAKALDLALHLDEVRVAAKWEIASVAAGNLSKILLPKGRIFEAVEHARRSVELADRSRRDDDLIWKVATRAWLGDALYQSGRLWESEAAFRRAEEIQLKANVGLLRFSADFRYCELLLDQAKMLGKGWVESCKCCLSEVKIPDSGPQCQDIQHIDDPVLRRFWQVRQRADRELSGEQSQKNLYDSLRHLTLGRAWLLETNYIKGHKQRLTKESREEEISCDQTEFEMAKNAKAQLELAVNGLRQVGHQTYLPRALLTLAAARRVEATIVNDDKLACFKEAKNCLDQALEIITRGGMLLLEADYHLELARLNWTIHNETNEAGHRRQALLSLTDAEALSREMGYGRRETEIAMLKKEIFAAVKAID